jgi:Zn finger protein HypA/HybF involved in hydrogenase expression
MSVLVYMIQKKELDKNAVVFALNTFNENTLELTSKTSIKKSKGTIKKRDPKQDLETARMDAVE